MRMRGEGGMAGADVLFATFGVVAVVAGFGLFVSKLVGARRGTNSRNLEYGVMPAMAIAIGLFVLEWAAGWPGWPVWVYVPLFLVLAVAFCTAILRAGNRDPIDS